MEQLTISYDPKPESKDLQIIEDGLSEFDREEFGRAGSQTLTFFLRDTEGIVLGGVHGNTGPVWAYVSSLWVTERLRGSGFGGQLLRAAEQEAVRRGCSNCYLDTFNPRALKFYLKGGYVIFGELEDFIPGGKRFFLRKKLV